MERRRNRLVSYRRTLAEDANTTETVQITPEADMTTIQQQLRREIPLRDAAFGITGYEPINPDGPLAADHIYALEAACKRVLPLIEAAGREEVTDTRDWDEAEAMIREALQAGPITK